MYYFTEKMQRPNMAVSDYIQALEEERRKIQVFSKELPLSLELVSQAIEACKQQLSGTTSEHNLNGQSECSEQTTSTDGPVLEEFIPIKKRASSSSSPSCDEDDEGDEQHSHKRVSKENSNNSDKKKSDWLRSVQLWNPDPPAEEDVTKKVPGIELKKSRCGGGAFQPFHKEERSIKASESLTKAPSSTGAAAASSKAQEHTAAEKIQNEGQRKQRRCWSQDLHKRFLHALQQLGGADSATPKQIRELMNVDGLTNDEVKSHLQKYRLHTRRPTPMVHNNNNPQTAPFVLVGNIFVQSPEYAAVTTSTASREVATVAAPAGIYAPVATHPLPVSHPPAESIKKSQFKKVDLFVHSNSEERANHSDGAVHSNSPTSSSSTDTSTSPGY